MVVATKLVAEGKCNNLEEAVSKIECGICHGKYHVQADCRRNQYPNPASSYSNREFDKSFFLAFLVSTTSLYTAIFFVDVPFL